MKTLFKIGLVAFYIASTPLFAQSRVSKIEAKLFYNENKEFSDATPVGTFSTNVIDNAEFPLFNTIIGAGGAEGYSHQTIVIVEISSKNMSGKDQFLQFSAKVGNRVLLNQRKKFSVMGDDTKYQLLFLLSDTGCEEIVIKASLMRGTTVTSTMTKPIEFICGE